MEIQQIKSQVSILEVLSHYGITPSRNNMIHCPFHDDKTPSMQVYPTTDTVYCFSARCSTHGHSLDTIDVIMRKEGISKHEAILKAQSFTGSSAKQAVSTAKAKGSELSRIAVLSRFWQQAKEAFSKSVKAKEYFIERQLEATALEVGYAVERYYAEWNEPMKKAAAEIGLIRQLPHGTYAPHFRSCLLFAHRNKAGQIVDIYGRSLSSEKDQRHFYLPGSHQGLYPCYPGEQTEKVILTESHIDAASLYQYERIRECYGVLACYGTNGFTKEHEEALKSLPALKEVIIFFDGDEAGREGASLLKTKLSTLALTVTIVETPSGEDVNSLLQGHDEKVLLHLLKAEEREEPLLFSNEKENEQQQETAAPEVSGNLNTSNPDQITYSKGNLFITILGGINFNHLDRLRVTLKINVSPQLSPLHSLRHNLDLYHDEAVQKFIRRAAEKLEKGSSEIGHALSELTEALERYRLEEIENRKQKTVKRKELSAQEIEAAKKYLSEKGLMERTMHALNQAGIVGENINAMILYIAMSSRKSEDPVSVICLSSSGMGKSYLQERVAECMPEEDRIENTQFSENSFYYFKRDEIKGKIFIIEDLEGAQGVLYPIRELQSKKRISKTVTLKDNKGNLRTVTLVVEGPVCVVAASTKEKIYEDNANRSLLIQLDSSHQQDKRIMDYQKQVRAAMIDRQAEEQTREQLRNIQRLLRPVKVVNPYAPLIELPEEVFKPRRTIGLLLSFIEAVTLYHQYQLKEVGGVVETEPEHIEWSLKLLKEILFAKSDELSGATRNFFEKLKEHLEGENKKSFYGRDIRKPLQQSPRNVQRYLYELLQYGYVKITGGSRHGKGYEYEVADYHDYHHLQSSIEKKLSEMMEKIRQARAERQKGGKRGSDAGATK